MADVSRSDTGAVNGTWQATGTRRPITRLNRDAVQASYAVQRFNRVGISDYSRANTTPAVPADDQVSTQIALSVSVPELDREPVRTLPPNLFFPTDLPGTLFGCDVGNDRRNGSGQLATGLRSDRFSCYAQLSLP